MRCLTIPIWRGIFESVEEFATPELRDAWYDALDEGDKANIDNIYIEIEINEDGSYTWWERERVDKEK